MQTLDKTTKILLGTLAVVGVALVVLITYFLFFQNSSTKIRNVGVDTNLNTASTSVPLTPINTPTSTVNVNNTSQNSRVVYAQNLINTQADWKTHNNDESGFKVKIPTLFNDSIASGIQSVFNYSLPTVTTNSTSSVYDLLDNKVATYIGPFTAENDQGACISSGLTNYVTSDGKQMTNIGARVLLRLGPISAYRQKRSMSSSIDGNSQQMEIVYRFYLQSSTCYEAKTTYSLKNSSTHSKDAMDGTSQLETALQNVTEAIISTFATN